MTAPVWDDDGWAPLPVLTGLPLIRIQDVDAVRGPAQRDGPLNEGQLGPAALRVLLRERRGQHERDLALPQHVAGLVPHLRFEAGVGDHVEPERVALEERALARVADEEPHVVDLAKGNVLHDASCLKNSHR